MIKKKSHFDVELRISPDFKKDVSFHNAEGYIYINNVRKFVEELDLIVEEFGEGTRSEILALIEGMHRVYQNHDVDYDSVSETHGTTIVKFFDVDQSKIRVAIEYLTTPCDEDDILITISWDK